MTFSKLEWDLAEELLGRDAHVRVVREIRNRALEEAALHIERNADEAQVIDECADRVWRATAQQLRFLKGRDR